MAAASTIWKNSDLFINHVRLLDGIFFPRICQRLTSISARPAFCAYLSAENPWNFYSPFSLIPVWFNAFA